MDNNSAKSIGEAFCIKKIAVIGLGLIGGSLAKALKKYSDFLIYGYDNDKLVNQLAKSVNAVDGILSLDSLDIYDIVFVCLHPDAAVDFILKNYAAFKKGCIVTDVCGVKSEIVDKTDSLLSSNGMYFVGGHPMAGKERSGFLHSDSDLFKNASYIFTKTTLTDEKALGILVKIIKDIGCKPITTTAQIHDRVIAYTSQLAHLVSSSYVKSKTIELESGFTGGSFQDMTRVAFLDENLWTALFLHNKENILAELETIIANLSHYKNAIKNNDHNQLKKLLKDGKEIKQKHLK